jgi:hypothetical protein
LIVDSENSISESDETNNTSTVVQMNVTAFSVTNADLSGLELSAGSLSPAFSASTTNYTIKIPDTIDSTTVTATLSEASATFTINGTAGTSGIPSNAISLSEGSTTISIVLPDNLIFHA